jgi:hypothetical protein
MVDDSKSVALIEIDRQRNLPQPHKPTTALRTSAWLTPSGRPSCGGAREVTVDFPAAITRMRSITN